MRTTVTLDDGLLAEAIGCTGIEEKSRLINHALRELINRERAERFLALEGTMPEIDYAPRDFRYGREVISTAIVNESHE
jgi:metal-responsive CopG/Arc/MetJ family transcriptional regulator